MGDQILSVLHDSHVDFVYTEEGGTHKDVEAGGFKQCDLVGDFQRGEARELLGELNCLDNAFGGQLTELVPKTDVQ